MKYNKIRLVGATNVDFPIIGADPEGVFVLKAADGLGPPERAVHLAVTVQEGGVRQGTRTNNRQVVMRVGLQPDWDIGQTSDELRTILYGLLTPKYDLPVKVQLMMDSTVVAQAQGDVSNLEASIFTKDPEVQITLDCDYPYFLAPAIKYQVPARSTVSGKTAIDVTNDGTAPSGFWIGVTLQSAQSGSLVLSDDIIRQSMTIGGAWEAGDTLIMDTRAGSRGVWKITSGSTVQQSVLNLLTGTSAWMQLHGGANRLLLNNLAFNWYGNAFGHTAAYWGV